MYETEFYMRKQLAKLWVHLSKYFVDTMLFYKNVLNSLLTIL